MLSWVNLTILPLIGSYLSTIHMKHGVIITEIGAILLFMKLALAILYSSLLFIMRIQICLTEDKIIKLIKLYNRLFFRYDKKQLLEVVYS